MIRSNLDMGTVVVRKESIDTTEIDGEKAMMDLDRGKYFILNGVGSSIWDIISEPCSVKCIVECLLKEYDVDSVTCEKNVLEFLQGMIDAKLITIN